MLSERVKRVEEDVAAIKVKLSSIEVTLGRIEGQLNQMPKAADFGRVDGRVASIPTWWQMLTMLVSIWGAGAAIVFAVMRYSAN